MTYDAIVIGAGVFGAWTAYHLLATGRKVALLDAYGPGNSRSSSGDESRVLRAGYGPDELYTRWAMRSRAQWIQFFAEAGRPELFQRTGVLWTPPPGERRAALTLAAFKNCQVACEELSPPELLARYPQLRFSSDRIGVFECEGGALLARQSVQTVVREAIRKGAEYARVAVEVSESGRVKTDSGVELKAGQFFFACGSWLPKIFPRVLDGRIRPTRQEVFYFGVPAGERRFSPPAMPVWIDFSDELGAYSIPEIDGRGFKLAFDRHGEEFDPDQGNRIVTGVEEARQFVAERFPPLAGAPVVESRVCQYENTSSGDFLIDRHPEFPNMWLVGRGSGHGFKHGPAVGEYVARMAGDAAVAKPRFSLASKVREANRSVY